jgi:hypothetical protein
MLTKAQLKAVSSFDFDTQNALASALGDIDSLATAGAVSLSTETTYLDVTGTMAFTLAAGTVTGQKKRLVCTTAATTPLGTVTITSPETATGMVCPATLTFDTVGQSVDLRWSGSKWRIERARRAGVLIVVVGTTVLTGFHLAHTYSTSVTGTVSSTGNRALPDGLFPGDQCIVACSTAAATPIGNINFTGLTLANVAATDLQAIGATTDTVTLTWTGTKWLVIANSGITVA